MITPGKIALALSSKLTGGFLFALAGFLSTDLLFSGCGCIKIDINSSLYSECFIWNISLSFHAKAFKLIYFVFLKLAKILRLSQFSTFLLLNIFCRVWAISDDFLMAFIWLSFAFACSSFYFFNKWGWEADNSGFKPFVILDSFILLFVGVGSFSSYCLFEIIFDYWILDVPISLPWGVVGPDFLPYLLAGVLIAYASWDVLTAYFLS